MPINNPANINASTPLPVAQGGTGGTSALTDGQLWIGNTGDPPTAASLTAGTGITITPGAGSISISNTNPSGDVKAWGKFDNTGAILSSAGVTSVTRFSQGQYDVVLNFAFANANYAIVGTGYGGYTIFNDPTAAQTTTTFRIAAANGGGYQDDQICFMCIGAV